MVDVTLFRKVRWFAVLGLFLLWHISNAGPARAERVLLDRVVAVVNGEVITWSQLRGFIPPDLVAEANNMEAKESSVQIRRLESRYLEEMVEIRLQAQAAEAEGITVSDAEVDRAVEGIRQKFSLSDEGLAKALDEQGLTLASYRSNLREQILASRVVNKVVRPKVTVSDEEVDREMALEYPDLAHRNIAVRLRLIRLEDGGGSDTERLVDQIVAEYGNGVPFSELASRYSKDPTAASGGDVGVVRRGMLRPELESVAFSMEENKISAPVTVDGSLYLLLVEGYEDQSQQIVEARRKITEKLQNKKMEKEYLAWLRQLKGKAYVETKLN